MLKYLKFCFQTFEFRNFVLDCNGYFSNQSFKEYRNKIVLQKISEFLNYFIKIILCMLGQDIVIYVTFKELEETGNIRKFYNSPLLLISDSDYFASVF